MIIDANSQVECGILKQNQKSKDQK